MGGLVVLFLVLTAVGAYLTLIALFPKRRGDTPYCRKCRYNLTGIDLSAETARCPECGTYLGAAKTILIGDRHVRRRRVAVGVLLTSLGGLPLGTIAVGTLLAVDWYRFKPTAWVLADIKSGSLPSVVRASDELRSRISGGALSRSQQTELIEVCLAEMARFPMRSPCSDILLGVLAGPQVRPLLTAAHEEQLYSQCLRYIRNAGRVFVVEQARQEVRRQLGTGALSAKQKNDLVELCLAEQEREKLRPIISQNIVDLLSDPLVEPSLTDVQRARMFANCVRDIRMAVRPSVIAGEECPLEFACEPRAPSEYGVSCWVTAIRSNGKRGHMQADWSVRGCDTCTHGRYHRLDGAGRCEIEVELSVAVFAGSGGLFSKAAPLYGTARTLTGLTELLPEEPADYIKLIRSPELDAEVAACVTVSPLSVIPSPRNPDESLVSIEAYFAARRPCNLAFEAWAEFDGRSFALGTFAVGAERTIEHSQQLSPFVPGALPAQVSIILKASKLAAKRTIDLFEIWDGALLFENVPCARTPQEREQRYKPTVISSPSDRSSREQPANP